MNQSSELHRVPGPRKLLAKPGWVFALMFILYGPGRFAIEFLRDDNPFELAGLTISQLIGIGMLLLGLVLAVVFQMISAEPRGNRGSAQAVCTDSPRA